MNVELPRWITTELVLIVGGFLWAIAGVFLPQLATIPVPGIGLPGVLSTPAFEIGPGQMIVLGLVPVVLKYLHAGKTPFVNAPAAKEEADA